MERTKNRALAKGLISARNAILFAIFLALFGMLTLFLYTNYLTVAIAATGFFVYVVLYSMWKGRTIYGTAIGSIAGAVPPVVGYCAVTNCLDSGAILLFLTLIFWQMPHFFSIALFRFNDYTAADIPVLPVKKGIIFTKKRMILYILAFMITALMLTVFGYTGYAYLTVAALLGLGWLWLCLKGFKSNNDQLWARSMFRFSLIIISGLCIMIPLDVV